MSVLALDLGTSSSRSALFDARGRRVADSLRQSTYPLHTDADGRAELDPAVVLKTVQGLLAGREADAVGISCFWHSLLGCADDGTPLTPIYTWADTRCAPDAAALRRKLDEREVHARTGCMLRASFWPAKLAWLKRTQPKLFARVAYWVGPAEWLVWRLGGELRCAHGMATATGLYDPATCTWDPLMVKRCGLKLSQLPPISDAPVIIAGLPPIYPGIGDGAANNLGVGATKPGLAAVNFGTSAAVRIVRDRGAPRAPFGLFCYRIDTKRFLIGGAITNAGGLRQWCVKRLQLPEPAALETELAARPGPHPYLLVLPFWMGERAPTWREDLSGAITGIRQATTSVDLLQAVTEATYQRLATIVERVPGARGPLRILVGGGIQRSPAAFQRLADCIGKTLVAAEEPETSLRGAAVFALERLGRKPAAIGGTSVRPRARHVAAYRAQRRTLAKLEDTLFPAAD
jgi:gluconokinase